MAFRGNTGVRGPGPVEVYRAMILHTQVIRGTEFCPLHPPGVQMLASSEYPIIILFKSLLERICCSILH